MRNYNLQKLLKTKLRKIFSEVLTTCLFSFFFLLLHKTVTTYFLPQKPTQATATFFTIVAPTDSSSQSSSDMFAVFFPFRGRKYHTKLYYPYPYLEFRAREHIIFSPPKLQIFLDIIVRTNKHMVQGPPFFNLALDGPTNPPSPSTNDVERSFEKNDLERSFEKNNVERSFEKNDVENIRQAHQPSFASPHSRDIKTTKRINIPLFQLVVSRSLNKQKRLTNSSFISQSIETI